MPIFEETATGSPEQQIGPLAPAEAPEAPEAPPDFPTLAIEELRAGREQAREDLLPFAEAGTQGIEGLQSLIQDPAAQADFIKNNPFFGALADQAQRRLFNNQAARGKVGSGGTAEGLQTSLLGVGSDLLNQNISQRQNLVTMGANAAAGQATATQQTSAGVSDLFTQMENMRQAQQVARRNRRGEVITTAATLTALALSDRRTKKDIKKVGKLDNGLPVYTFKYKGDNKIHMNVMAQELEKKNPSAVLNIGGVKFVDMEKVNAP